MVKNGTFMILKNNRQYMSTVNYKILSSEVLYKQIFTDKIII